MTNVKQTSTAQASNRIVRFYQESFFYYFLRPAWTMMDPNDYSGFDQDDVVWDNHQEMDYRRPMNHSRPPKTMNFNRRRGSWGNFGPQMGYRGPPPFFGPPPPMRPLGPMDGPPAMMWGRGFGPRGPPNQFNNDNKAMRYLLRCGVAKEHLKGLPRALLQLIEPEHCGICGHNFDSYNSSRLHYISKNHLKSQKKWLAKQSDVGHRQRPKEVPLKARNLYCELCDVQITSQAHADSHYSGRPHRAIVERRKKPKNPILLTKDMHERVLQLIRREKKHLKPQKELNEEALKEKDVKPVSPELYCEICKTSVTCSEQMTIHLNGKKHLVKEKQHILKMMKIGPAANATSTVTGPDATKGPTEGQASASKDKIEATDVETGASKDQAGATEAQAGSAEDQEEGSWSTAEDETEEHDDDWTNGSGNWDEPAATS